MVRDIGFQSNFDAASRIAAGYGSPASVATYYERRVYMSAGTETVHMSASQAAAILQNFVAGELLTIIPARRAKKLVVFAWLSERFAPDAVYSEGKVNALLRAAHEDVATLRRGMYDEHFLDRRDGAYRRTPQRQKLIIDGDAPPRTVLTETVRE